MDRIFDVIAELFLGCETTSLLLLLFSSEVMSDSCDPLDSSPSVSTVHGIFPVSTGVGSHFLLQGIFPTQGLNPHLLLGMQIFY